MTVIADLLPTRLVWEPGRGGLARMGGVQVTLTQPPDLGAGPVYALDFVPGEMATVSTAQHEPERLMLPDECAAAGRLLEHITKEGRAP